MPFIRNIFLLFLPFFALAKLPELTPRDVKGKLEEIFKGHATHKSLTVEVLERSFANFLEELDPTKTYFLQEEVATWTSPSEETLLKALASYKKGDFSPFREMYLLLPKAVERRALLEKEVAQLPLPKGVSHDEFQKLDWAASSEDLLVRLLRIKGLQQDAMEKLGGESREKLEMRLVKKRLHREGELLHEVLEEREKVFLSYVLKAIASALDAHTNYFTPNEANQFMIQVQQRLFGIGAELRDNLDGLLVVRILENSPASQSNQLKLHDKIVAVNGEPIIGMEITEAVELIRGEKGTSVSLTILREGGEEKVEEPFHIELTRGEVVLEESRLETIYEPFGDGAIATLRLFSFYQDQKSSSAADIRRAIEKGREEHSLKGVILDLRGNAGGLLNQAVGVTGLFIQKGIVVSIKDNTGKLQHLRETEGNPVWRGPLVILVNRASASAAEIVAQTLKDYGRAIVVGDPETFGKGSFQTFTLDPVHHPKVSPQGEHKVTRGRYYTVSGKSPQLVGVGADIVIPGLLSELEVGERYAKFPLENDEIAPHFEDDLADVSPFQRIQLGPSYRNQLQPRLSTYTPYLEGLRRNSEKRIGANRTYQNFLTELRKKNFDSEWIDRFGQSDLQYVEALNVIKDLIFLVAKESR